MTEARFSITKSNGWTRLGLPGAVSVLFGTPMLWALGTFDSTTEPPLHAIVFGLFGILFFGLVPLLIGWALQGFVIRRKASEDGDEAPDARPPAPRPVAAHAPAPRGRAS
jgi:hypothetical protein